MDFEASQDILEGTLSGFNVSIELADMILQALNPSLLLGDAQVTLFLVAVDKLHNFISQSLVLHEAGVGEGRVDGGDDGWGEGLHMYRWLC